MAAPLNDVGVPGTEAPGGDAAAGARTIALVGFMGAGKSTAARALAESLGLEAVDGDAVIEERAGKSVSEIFAQDGESAFRALEARTVVELVRGGEAPRVVALGGGAVTAPEVREALADALVIWLDISAEAAWERCQGSGRPLAAEREAFVTRWHEREPLYAEVADVVVPSDLADFGPVLEAARDLPPGVKLLWGTSASGDYPAYIGPGLLAAGFWPDPAAVRRFLVTDGHVGRLYGDRLGQLDGRVTIMPGEQSKTVAHAEIVWTELARAGLTRRDVVVALGGGVVGDLAGFCAATYQRGVPYVQVPTTLVAQVDSAYGGKTGIDLDVAKNYVGAYHLPRAVLADTDTLATLPAAEVAAGYAEVLKTALIAGGELWERVRGGAPATDPAVITACAQTKLRVVAADERDAGLRQVLNLGHTVGHAIETVTGYAAYRHGEAVGLGLLAALRLSEHNDLRAEVLDLLAAQGLPTVLEHADPAAVVMATARDKKRVGESPVPFVLLEAPGAARPGCTVGQRALIAAVRELAPR